VIRKKFLQETNLEMVVRIQLVISCLIIAANYATAFAQLPGGQSPLFSGSGNCALCHASNGQANTENGVDVSPVTQWRSTMMANSARDPLWRAKVSAEIATFPALREAIESKCTRCHAPMGHAEAEYHGAPGYSIAEMISDPLALDGVSCTLCHQIQPGNLGDSSSYSGRFQISDSGVIFGPFPNPLGGPMRMMSGYTPTLATHTANSELCATCHTLFTAHVNDQGELEGSFPEQTPYLEWKNSRFQSDGIECQSCHMPVSPSSVDIATMPGWHQELRSPYAYHTMTGANVSMLSILRDNIDELGINASGAQFDSSIARTRSILETQTVALSENHVVYSDSAMIDIKLENLTGHKLPTGIPIRRMWLHFRATDGLGNTVFESGNWDQLGEVVGLDAGYEPHHNVVTEPGQVPIYETIMDDSQGNLTWTLLSAAGYRKDNRLPPMGFLSSAAVYDSVRIEGLALQDPDFNLDARGEGSGADIVHYRFPMPEEGPVTVLVEVCYQTLPPRVFTHLASHDTPEVHLFSQMYNDADKSPTVIASLGFSFEGAPSSVANPLPTPVRLNQNVPNPFNPSTLISYELDHGGTVRISVHDVGGKLVRTLVAEFQEPGAHATVWDGTDDRGVSVASGIYLYTLQTDAGRTSRRMMLVR
jgi:hypothetical protein